MEGTAVPIWAIAVVLGPVILGAVMAYGSVRNRKKRKKIDAARKAEARRP